MVLCLRCWRLWPRKTPSGDTVFCGTCQQPLGLSRLCTKSGHRNPPHAQVCLICADRSLTGFAPCLDLTWLSRLGALVVVGAGLRLTWTHLCSIVRVVIWALIMALSVVFSVPPRRIEMALAQVASWLLVIYAASWLLPARAGGALRTWLRTALRLSWRTATTVTDWLWKTAITGTGTAKKKRPRK